MTAEDRDAAIRSLWAAGSYAEVGDRWAFVGQHLADELAATVGLEGRRVLDAACGTGNTTLALARAGAHVVGVDLTPELLEIARQRAVATGADVDLREGDLLDLPVDSDAFDVVTSTFGAFIADDPRACAAELARATVPGGTIALTAWTDGGPFRAMREVVFRHHPDLAEMPRPAAEAWATRGGLEDFFAGTGARLTDLQELPAPLPFDSVEHAFAFMSEHSGPFLRTRAAVEERGGSWDGIGAEVVEAWRAHARPAGDGGIELVAPYGRALLAVA